MQRVRAIIGQTSEHPRQYVRRSTIAGRNDEIEHAD